MPVSFPQLDSARRLRRQYGSDFPDLSESDPEKQSQAWKRWLEGQRDAQKQTMQDRRLHWSRNRSFGRLGLQHISTRDGRTWREPYAGSNNLRAKIDIIGPSLDFRHGVIAEQRPGFRHELLKATVDARERAEAQQAVAEYYFHKQNAWRSMRDAIYHAQTDGVCFVQGYVDKLAGPQALNAHKLAPDDPRAAGFLAQGYQQDEQGFVIVPLDETGNSPMPPGTEVSYVPEGDLAYRVVLAHDTFADPEARTLNGAGDRAKWFAVRRLRDLYTARIETGNDKLEPEALDTALDACDIPLDTTGGWQAGLPPFPSHQQRYKDAVYDWSVYIAPNGQDIQQGMWVRLLGGQRVDGANELPGGVYPFARFSDGSPDPSLYPQPVMSRWNSDQISINAIYSMLLQHVRINGLGRIMGVKGTVVTESYNAIVGSFLEYEGMQPEQFKAQDVGGDVWQLLQFAIRKLEDKTGWNDLARGQVLGQAGGGMQDVSGRAVLGAREMLERTFGPMVQAAAEGATEWAEMTVKMAAWLFGDTPRLIPTVGGRGDLAKYISKEQLQGDVSTYVEPATMMPQPAQLRQQMLQEMLGNGLISLAEFQKRSPFALTRDVHMGDVDHAQRAQWINTLIEERTDQYAAITDPATLYSPEVGLPIFWQDDPVVHLLALNELILDERKAWPMRKLAQDRAGIYEELAQARADANLPVPLEIIGVPLNRIRATAMQAAGGGVPAQQPATAPQPGGAAPPSTPAQGGEATPTGMSDQAQPLGSFGQVEAAASSENSQR